MCEIFLRESNEKHLEGYIWQAITVNKYPKEQLVAQGGPAGDPEIPTCRENTRVCLSLIQKIRLF